jgi:hypothetical protein
MTPRTNTTTGLGYVTDFLLLQGLPRMEFGHVDGKGGGGGGVGVNAHLANCSVSVVDLEAEVVAAIEEVYHADAQLYRDVLAKHQ